MSVKYKKLFESLRVGKLTIKNRISTASLGMAATADPCEGFTKDAQEYYVERAKGGAGLIITGITNVSDNEMAPMIMPFAAYSPPMFTKSCVPINERIHAYDSKIFLQLTGGFGKAAIPSLMKDAIAPSDPEERLDSTIHHKAMTIDEIREMIASFVTCAVVARESKFDGVEIHAVHECCLPDQYAIDLYNHKRTDEYGGDLRNRLKLSTDIVKGIKAACGEDYPVSMGYSFKSFVKSSGQGAQPCENFVERDKNIAEGVEAAKILVEAGYDLLNVDAGSCDTWYWNHPPVHFEKGMYCDFGKILKENVNVPIILADIMDNPDRALSTCCDIIGYGRTQSAKIIFQKKSGSKSFRVSVNTFPSVWTVRIDSQEENFKSIETLMSLLARNRKTREERS